MQTQKNRLRRKVAQVAGGVALVLVFTVAIWIDVATGLWQQAVILSGIAAGLLTFLLTALFFERWMAGADHRRWYPVTHVALTDLLHALADEQRSQFSRGAIVPRTIEVHPDDDHEAVLARIIEDRRSLTHALSRWAGFLAASADVQGLMDHIARLALLLDEARDAVLDAESAPADQRAQDAVARALRAVDDAVGAAAAEIEATLGALRPVEARQTVAA